MIRDWYDVVVAVLMYGGLLTLIAKLIIRWRRESADEKKSRDERRAKRELEDEAKARETERRKRLRERDGEVDAIVAKCIVGKLALEQLLSGIKTPTFSNNDLLELKRWCDLHPLTAGLIPDTWSHIAGVLNDGYGIEKEKAFWDLDCEMSPDSCFRHADELLGLERHYMGVDSGNSGWFEMESASGKYERVDSRYDRIFLKVPGADRGYIYVLTNPAMPGLVKVGWTKTDPTKRAASLSGHTGVPAAFEVAYSTIVGNCRLIERLTHERLQSHRSQRNREFFRLSVADAVLAIQSVIAETGAR